MEEALNRSGLFDGILETDLPKLLRCTGGRNLEFAPRETVLPAGETPARFCVLLAGSATAGEREILPGGLAGGVTPGAQNVIAWETGARALVFRADRVTYACGVSCAFHHRMADNLRRLLAAHYSNLTND